MEFLVQRKGDETYASRIMNEMELINYINEDDLHDEEYVVYDISEFGRVVPLRYVGWQPNCLIELVDESGKVVVRGYGVDH